ncbi:MAG TPA: DNA translocase FtsK [Bacteroidales bacterium]|nr:DNA translocase FtsK [Bacteroidales bacterium]
MGKKNKNTKKTSFSFIKEERFKITVAVFILFLSIYILLAFTSYFFTWKTDQSFEWSRVLSGSTLRVENWAGKAGAWLSNLFLNKWFGIASFVVPFLLIIVGLRFLKIRLLPLGRTFRVSIVGAILLSVILGYFSTASEGFLGSGPGGAHGYIISEWLNALIGRTGTAFLLLLALFAFVVFSFKGPYEWIEKVVFRSSSSGSNTLKNKKPATATVKSREDITKEVVDDRVDLVFETPAPSSEETSTEEEIPTGDDENFTVRQIKKEEAVTTEEEADEGPNLTIEKPVVEENGKDNLSVNELGEYDPTLDLSSYKPPPVSLLEDHHSGNSEVSNEELISNKNKIVETLANYKIQIDKIKATIGPTVTLYEIVPAPGIRISKIKNLEDDIALSLAALGIRIIAPIPGRGTIGIEVPNQQPEIVSMKSIVTSRKFQESKYDLAIAMGKTISNETYVFDLTKMPHLLVAGATGQGKSVGLNAIIASLLYKKHPAQLKFVLIDPKKVELTLYSKIEKHFLAKLPDSDEAIITDTQKVINTLNSLTIEMEARLDLFKKAHVRNVKEYNGRFINRKLNPENGHRFLPYIVVIIDEFADLIMTAGKEIETPIARLAQLARAVGIHLIIATQRPTTNIITGVIKANFPARVAFRVTSMIDSRTILDGPGANQLIGRGDMLISDGGDLTRIQCAFIDIPELDRITEYIGGQQSYPTALYLPEYSSEESNDPGEVDLSKRDSMFEEAARLVVIHQQGSTSLIQRKFSIGYNRAGRIVDQLEAAGIVGPFEGSKARQVLIQDEYSLEQILNEISKL